jgi:hypothetical protein
MQVPCGCHAFAMQVPNQGVPGDAGVSALA